MRSEACDRSGKGRDRADKRKGERDCPLWKREEIDKKSAGIEIQALEKKGFATVGHLIGVFRL